MTLDARENTSGNQTGRRAAPQLVVENASTRGGAKALSYLATPTEIARAREFARVPVDDAISTMI